MAQKENAKMCMGALRLFVAPAEPESMALLCLSWISVAYDPKASKEI